MVAVMSAERKLQLISSHEQLLCACDMLRMALQYVALVDNNLAYYSVVIRLNGLEQLAQTSVITAVSNTQACLSQDSACLYLCPLCSVYC